MHVSTITVLHLALHALIKNQIKKLNKIAVARTAIGIDKKALKNRKVQDCVLIRLMTFVHLPFCFWHINLSLCRV